MSRCRWRRGESLVELSSGFRQDRAMLRLQAIARLAHGEDVPRMRRVALELLPQLEDVGINGAAHHRGVMAPHFPEQIVARRHGTASVVEREQQVELQWREIHRLALLRDDPAGALDRDLAESLGERIGGAVLLA